MSKLRICLRTPKKAFEQLANLEAEIHDTAIVYKCPAGQHDDLPTAVAATKVHACKG